MRAGSVAIGRRTGWGRPDARVKVGLTPEVPASDARPHELVDALEVAVGPLGQGNLAPQGAGAVDDLGRALDDEGDVEGLGGRGADGDHPVAGEEGGAGVTQVADR